MIKVGKTWQGIKKKIAFYACLNDYTDLQASEIPDPEHIPTNSSTSPTILGSLNGLSNPWEAAHLSPIKNDYLSTLNDRQ